MVFFVILATSARADLISGYWTCTYVYSGTNYPQDLELTQNGNTISGSAVQSNHGATFATVSGSISGNQVTFTDDYTNSSYEATSIGTVSGDSMSGTWTSNASQMGSFSCTRGTTVPAPTATPDPNATPDSRRASGVAVICNRGPQPGDYFQCTATVSAADTQPPNPSGIVSFSTTDSKGSFPFGTTCLLGHSQMAGNTSFCVATYANPTLSIGTVVPVIAEYQGDATYQPSSNSGKLPKTTVARIPSKPKVCFSEKQDACKGLNAIIDPLQFRPDGIGYITTSYFGPLNSNQSSRRISRGLAAPKRKGDVAVQIDLQVRSKENADLGAVAALQSFNKNLKSGLTIASTRFKLKFAEVKDITLTPKSAAISFIQAAASAGVTTLNVQIQVRVLRVGDQAVKISKTVAAVPVSAS